MQKCTPDGEQQEISPTRNGVPTRKQGGNVYWVEKTNYHNSLAILKWPVMSSIMCLLFTRIISDPQQALLFQILKLWNQLQEIIILLMVYEPFQYMDLASIQQHYSSRISSILKLKFYSSRISQESHVLQQYVM